jgi:long-chain acyl-CoA synthetase
MNKDDVHLSYLPLPHLFERAVYISLFYNGGKLFFLAGDISTLKDALAKVRPTFFATVPRLHLRFHDVIKEKLT